MRVPLRRVAHVRSGDKGDISTLALIAYSPEFYPLLKAQVTAAVVRDFYGRAVTGRVDRYEVDAIEALNFTLHGALGGGVSRSLAIDNYGKALSAALLGLEIDVPDGLANHLRGA